MKAFFEIGQKVVCVESKSNHGFPSGLIEGKQYEVTSVSACRCGTVGITVGVIDVVFSGWRCVKCNHVVRSEERIYAQARFVPLDFDRQVDEEIHQAMKGNLIEN